MKRVYGPRLTIGPQSDHYLLLEPIVRVELPERSLPDTGFKIIILLQQDEVGNRTVTGWPSSVRYVNDVDTVSLGPNDITICTLVTVDRGNTWIVELHPVNRPSGDPSAQWGSISGNIDDQPDLKLRLDNSLATGTSAGGDLSGTYPNPVVSVSRGIRETSGPTNLTLSTISDGQPIARIGTTVVGMTGVSWTQAGVLSLPGRINLPTTTGADVGVISVNSLRSVHFFGTDNAFFGRGVGNFTGTGARNTGLGQASLTSFTTGADNLGAGFATLQMLTSGGANTAVGSGALRWNQAQNNNTAVGFQSGANLIDGNQANGFNSCTYIGSTTRVSSIAATFETVIGANALGGGSNTVTLGRAADRVHVFGLRVYNGWTDPNNGQWLQLDNPSSSWVRLSAQANGTGAANIGVAISPRGTGAISAQIPDNTTTGGNARGNNAVDLQTYRIAAEAIASGDFSVIGGGRSNTSSGLESGVASGGFNTSSGTRSFIGGGSSNIAPGEGATVCGGVDNKAIAPYSWIPGGIRGNTRGIHGSHAWSGALRANSGDNEHFGNVLQRETTDATPTILTSDRAAPSENNVMVLPNNSVYSCYILIAARDTAGNGATWLYHVFSKRGASAANTVVRSVLVSKDVTELPTAATAIVANITNGSVEIQVTGVAATTIDWIADVMGVLTHR